MKKILAIAGLAVKAAIRSRLLLVLTVILLFVVLGLPASIKGDGTLQGQVILLIYYSLGLTTIVLGIATVWISCWSIAREVEEKHIQMLAVKPIRRSHIWIGKWLGILFINATLLSLSAAITYMAVEFKVSSSDANPDDVNTVRSEVLTCRQSIVPAREDINREAHEYLRGQLERGEVSEDMPHEEAYANACKVVAASRAAVPPGGSKQWTMMLDAGIKDDSRVALRYHLSQQARYRNPVKGRWLIEADSDGEPFVQSMDNYLSGRFALDIPAEVLAGAKEVLVTFENSDRDNSNVAVFDIDGPVELLIDKGSFASNYFRSVLMLFCHLALLAALGLTMSSLFTFPVASFTMISLLVISLLSHYFNATYGTDDGHHCHNHSHAVKKESAFKKGMERVVVEMNIVVAPAMKYQPLRPLTDGLLVSWKETGRALLVLLILYPCFFGLAAAWFLNKRELAL